MHLFSTYVSFGGCCSRSFSKAKAKHKALAASADAVVAPSSTAKAAAAADAADAAQQDAELFLVGASAKCAELAASHAK